MLLFSVCPAQKAAREMWEGRDAQDVPPSGMSMDRMVSRLFEQLFSVYVLAKGHGG